MAAVTAVMRHDGWTCDYHEPVDDPCECPDCDEAHTQTAKAVVAALDALDGAVCACGSPLALGVVHRPVSPCYLPTDEADLRERIAAEIEAARAVAPSESRDIGLGADWIDGETCAYEHAARIARGQS